MIKVRYILSISAVLFLNSCAIIQPYTDISEISNTLSNLQPKYIEIQGIKIESQPNKSTCGITSVTVVSNFINGRDETVNDLIGRNTVDIHSGTSVELIIKWLESELPQQNIEYHRNENPSDMIQNIFLSLSENKPVVIFFGSPNKFNAPFYDFHASVVYGIDINSNEITVANSYGFSETISLVDFLNRMAFTEREKYTSDQQFILNLGLIDKNMYFVIK